MASYLIVEGKVVVEEVAYRVEAETEEEAKRIHEEEGGEFVAVVGGRTIDNYGILRVVKETV